MRASASRRASFSVFAPAPAAHVRGATSFRPWAYWKFVRQREGEPATDIDVDLVFVGTQAEKWIVQVTATLSNKSQVRLEYRDFQVTVRYLVAGDPVEDGDERIAYQLRFKRNIDDRIPGKKRFFTNSVFINPKQEFRHRYITHLPHNATFVWVQCKYFYELRGHTYKTNTQRIFCVPKGPPGPTPSENASGNLCA